VRKAAGAKASDPKARIHCAIYTRKSSEEGLEQDFNSLDAQREACEAFIRSQKHEGWVCLPEMYDDGGISGATLERSALKRLLAEIEAGRIDTVVVYKVDRLTRSLSDFARIVEVFDRREVSFVAVTQQFNTTSSMGRLTLNMLLSFAQFEREVTGERIRDKIAASKRKGLWMGGLPPLGYDARERKLIVNPQEAETVRHIYRRYAALGSVRGLKHELDRDGIVSKARVDRFGRATGGKPLARGALYLMLQNRIYRSEIVHKGASYPGEHEAIIDAALWEQVQHQLAANRIDRAVGVTAKEPSLLAGLLFDETGGRMTPTYANKRGTRYRYYASQALVRGSREFVPGARRVPAGEVEGLVEHRLRQFLANETELFSAIETEVADANERAKLIARASELSRRWLDLEPSRKRAILITLVGRVELLRETLKIRLRPALVPDILNDPPQPSSRNQPVEERGPTVTFTVPARLKRTGMETRLLIDGPADSVRRNPDRSLCRLLAQAHKYHAMLMQNARKTMGQLAEEAGVSGSYFARVLKLSFLAPEVVRAILHGQQPIGLTAKRLVNQTQVSIGWSDQRTILGCG
jgi:DNA invertase Pin-like site-specific DNA recombinase